jgi:hypothetical protein
MEQLAGAVGLEPTPSSLTVRCPTNWTTPQPDHFILTAPRQEPKLRLVNSGGFSALSPLLDSPRYRDTSDSTVP